jgi:hypothetical protein
MDIRLSPEEVEKLASLHGFAKMELTEIGPYTYLMILERTTPDAEK